MNIVVSHDESANTYLELHVCIRYLSAKTSTTIGVGYSNGSCGFSGSSYRPTRTAERGRERREEEGEK